MHRRQDLHLLVVVPLGPRRGRCPSLPLALALLALPLRVLEPLALVDLVRWRGRRGRLGALRLDLAALTPRGLPALRAVRVTGRRQRLAPSHGGEPLVLVGAPRASVVEVGVEPRLAGGGGPGQLLGREAPAGHPAVPQNSLAAFFSQEGLGPPQARVRLRAVRWTPEYHQHIITSSYKKTRGREELGREVSSVHKRPVAPAPLSPTPFPRVHIRHHRRASASSTAVHVAADGVQFMRASAILGMMSFHRGDQAPLERQLVGHNTTARGPALFL